MLSNNPAVTRLIVALTDILVTVLSFIAAAEIRNLSLNLSPFGSAVDWHQYPVILVMIILVWRILLGYQEAYVGQRFTSLKTDVYVVLKTVLIGCMIVLSIAFFIKSDVPRTLILFFGVVNFIFLAFEKVVLYKLIVMLRESGQNIKNVLIVGTEEDARHFIESVRTHSDWGLRITGVVAMSGASADKENFMGEKLYHFQDFLDVLHTNHIEELIIALPANEFKNIEKILVTCDEEGVPVRIISPFFRDLISTAKTDLVHGIPVISFHPVERNDFEMALKRILDVSVSGILLFLLAPLFLLITIFIKAGSSGPIFYRWNVLGHHKRPLTSYKFRTMYEDADKRKAELMAQNEMKGAAFKMTDDPRITPVGKVLRKFSFDELPQLWSVLKGDLSLVGPRPPLQSEIEAFEGWHRRKLSVKPGITCLWQINGRNKINDFDEWMKLDLQYIDEWSLWLDIKILLKTIPAVLRGTGV